MQQQRRSLRLLEKKNRSSSPTTTTTTTIVSPRTTIVSVVDKNHSTQRSSSVQETKNGVSGNGIKRKRSFNNNNNNNEIVRNNKRSKKNNDDKPSLFEYDSEYKVWLPIACEGLTGQPLAVDLDDFLDSFTYDDDDSKSNKYSEHIRRYSPEELHDKMKMTISATSFYMGNELTYDEMAALVEPLEAFTIKKDRLLEKTITKKIQLPAEDVEAHRLIDEEILRQKRILHVANQQYEYANAARELLESNELGDEW